MTLSIFFCAFVTCPLTVFVPSTFTFTMPCRWIVGEALGFRRGGPETKCRWPGQWGRRKDGWTPLAIRKDILENLKCTNAPVKPYVSNAKHQLPYANCNARAKCEMANDKCQLATADARCRNFVQSYNACNGLQVQPTSPNPPSCWVRVVGHS